MTEPSSPAPSSCRVAADIGGTFTDIAIIDEGGIVATRKVLSTPDDYSRAVVDGVAALLDDIGLPMDALAEVLHGTTVATNAILERRGARTALITTRGMRDVLELRRIRMPSLYNPLYERPAPLVPREHRLEVEERVGGNGEIVTPLNVDDVMRAVKRMRRAGVESVAVTFLHAYLNDAHERRVAEISEARAPRLLHHHVSGNPARDSRVRAHQHHRDQRLPGTTGEELRALTPQTASTQRA